MIRTSRIIFKLVVVCLWQRVAVIVEKVIGGYSKTSIVISNYFRNIINSKKPKLSIISRETPTATITNKGKGTILVNTQAGNGINILMRRAKDRNPILT